MVERNFFQCEMENGRFFFLNYKKKKISYSIFHVPVCFNNTGRIVNSTKLKLDPDPE